MAGWPSLTRGCEVRGEDFELRPLSGEGAETEATLATLSVHVPGGLRWVRGHFPGDPIVPGVAQLIPLVERGARMRWPELGPVRGLRRLKFSAPIRPGEELELELRRGGEGGVIKIAFTLHKGEIRVSHGSLLFADGSLLFADGSLLFAG